jgi:hypothetical protein
MHRSSRFSIVTPMAMALLAAAGTSAAAQQTPVHRAELGLTLPTMPLRTLRLLFDEGGGDSSAHLARLKVVSFKNRNGVQEFTMESACSPKSSLSR